MEFFKQPNFDWMGKAKYFFALSGFLLCVAQDPIANGLGMIAWHEQRDGRSN